MHTVIDKERALYSSKPICRVLATAPCGYSTYRTRTVDPTQWPVRAQRDDVLREQI